MVHFRSPSIPGAVLRLRSPDTQHGEPLGQNFRASSRIVRQSSEHATMGPAPYKLLSTRRRSSLVTKVGTRRSSCFRNALASNSKDPMDQFRPVNSCEETGSVHIASTGEFTRSLFIFESANNAGQLILSPEKIFFSVAAENGADPLGKPNCAVEGGSGSPRADVCVLGLSQ